MLAPSDTYQGFILVSRAIRLQNVREFSDIDETLYVCKVLTRITLKIFSESARERGRYIDRDGAIQEKKLYEYH